MDKYIDNTSDLELKSKFTIILKQKEDKQILNNTELQVKAIQDKEIENIKNLTTNINTDMSNYLDNLQTNN